MQHTTEQAAPPVWRVPEGPEGPDHGARDRQRDPRVTAITTSAKVARNFPRSLLKTAQKRCNSNNANSNSEIVTGELRAKLLSSGQNGATHSRTSRTAGVQGTGETGGPGCGARGRRRGLAGQRVDAPSQARGADGSRAGRRPRRSPAQQSTRGTRNASGATSNNERRGRLAGGPPPTAQPGPDTLKPRPADAGRGLPTQSGGRV